MRFVRVQYDAYNRQFNVLDRELARDLKDGETYLITDFSTHDFLPSEQPEGLEAYDAPV